MNSHQHLPDNVLNNFFPLLGQLITANNLAAIDAVASQVLHYSGQQPVVMSGDNVKQQRIVRTEAFLIRTLHKLIEFRLQQLHLGTGEPVNVKELIERTDPRTIIVDDRGEIELAFHLYIFIVASIINLNTCDQPLANLDVEAIISEILSIKQAMHRHKNMMALMNMPTDEYVAKSTFVSLRMVNMNFVLDCDPDKSKDHFTVAMATLFVQKMMNLYNQLEARLRPLETRLECNNLPDGLEKVECRQLQDWLAVTAAMMRGMNLIHFKSEREKLTNQKEKIKLASRMADHTVWETGQKVDLVDYLFYYGPYSHVILDQCSVVWQYLYFVKNQQVPVPDYLQPTFVYRLQCIYHQLRILMQALQAQYTQLSKTDKLKLETSLGMLDNRIVCLLYAAHRLNPAIVRITPELHQSLDAIKTMAAGDLNLSFLVTEKICITTSELYEAKMSLILADAKDNEARLQVFTDFMYRYMELLLAYNDFITYTGPDADNVAFTRRFIVELYLLVLLKCRSHHEIEIILNNVLLEDVMTLMTGLEMESIYRYIIVMVSKYKAKYCEIDDVSPAFFSNLNQDDLSVMLSHLNKALMARLSGDFNICASLEAFLVEHGSYLSESLLKHALFGTNDMCRHVANCLEFYIKKMASSASGYLYMFLAKSQFYKPVRFADVKASFSTPVLRVPNMVQSNQSKKKSKAIEPLVATQPQFRIEDEFAVVFAANNNDLPTVIRLYEFAIKDRKKNPAIYGLLGLAECLTRMSGGKEKSALYHRLKEAAPAIFAASKQRIIWGKDHVAIMAHYQSLLIASGMERPPVVEKVSVVKPLPKPLPRKMTVTATKEIFFKVVHVQPAPKRERVQFYDMCKPVTDERKAGNLRNILTEHGKEVAKVMHDESLTPLVQGGAVQDALFNVPHRDVDMLCFATKADMVHFFNKYKDILHMKSFRFNKKQSNVMVIQFDVEKVGVLNAELEILFIDEKDKYAIDAALVKLARGFGINLVLYYDPIFDRLIDPLNQLRRILESHEIDVGSFFVVDLNKYFAEHPDRMLDMLYKMAKYKKYDIDLKISDDVLRGFTVNRQGFAQYFSNKEMLLSKFDKLFLQGFAVQSLALLTDSRFDCIYNLFPNLDAGFIEDLARACREIDAAVAAPENQPMTYIRREALRAQFMDTVLYHSFCYKRDLSALDEQTFGEASNRFILASNLAVTGELISRVQTLWADRLWPGNTATSSLRAQRSKPGV